MDESQIYYKQSATYSKSPSQIVASRLVRTDRSDIAQRNEEDISRVFARHMDSAQPDHKTLAAYTRRYVRYARIRPNIHTKIYWAQWVANLSWMHNRKTRKKLIIDESWLAAHNLRLVGIYHRNIFFMMIFNEKVNGNFSLATLISFMKRYQKVDWKVSKTSIMLRLYNTIHAKLLTERLSVWQGGKSHF